MYKTHCWFCENGPCSGECQTGARFDEVPKNKDPLSLKYLLDNDWIKFGAVLNGGTILLKNRFLLLTFNRENKLIKNQIKLKEIQIAKYSNHSLKVLFRGYCDTIGDFKRILNTVDTKHLNNNKIN